MKTQFIIILSITLTINVLGQDLPVILKAMQDEQQRSMKELRLDGHEAPFYISYTISDLKSYIYSASLGALIKSDSGGYRRKNVRVLVGDYDFNDESLDNNIYSGRIAKEIDLPLEDDYNGIRRALWATTDGIYRRAAQHFKENQNTLKEKGKPLAELPHRTFAKVQPQQVNRFKKFKAIDHARLEKYVKELSAFFRTQPDITSSKVLLSITQGHQYYANTEGTWYITPTENIRLDISASTGFGWMSGKHLVKYFTNVDLLPSIETFSELNDFAKSIQNKPKNETKTTEDYTGPILFTDLAVAEISMLLFGRDGLIADNNLAVENQYRMDNPASLDNKMGKLVVSDLITVKAKPKLKAYDGVQLLGSYEIDDEGVAPPDELTLIEKGVLKALLNDRSLTKPDQQANGHASGPGVIEVSFQDGNSMTELKQMLLIKAKEEGFDYAYMTKKLGFGMAGMGMMADMDMDMDGFGMSIGLEPMQFVRIEVATGKEELVTDVSIRNIAIKNFKKARATKGGLKAYNLPLGFGRGSMISIICPEGLLLEGIDISPNRMQEPDTKDQIFVEPPKQ